tara:strand:- start:529 stop:912 length:384 start_codon:yes stop_codon:yes gene_type:complete
MSCFWNGLRTKIDGLQFCRTPNEVLKYLKEYNKLTTNVSWQGQHLSKQQLLDNYISIEKYDKKNVPHGHLTAALDPFLLLVCELFICRIEFQFVDTKIVYEYKFPNNNKPTHPLAIYSFTATTSHFS